MATTFPTRTNCRRWWNRARASCGGARALADHGLQVPEDVAVVGFDDIPMARFAQPPLTTVAQDTTRAGELLVETLMKLVRGEPAESITLPVSLVVRRSSGASEG